MDTPGGRFYRDQAKRLNRCYRKVARRFGQTYRPRRIRRDWADAQDARKEISHDQH